MKIGQSPDNSVQLSVNNAATAQKNAQSASTTASSNASQSTRSAGVSVTVSTLARGLEKTGKGETADIDLQKVASVRSAIEDGTYVVNPEAIADKLLFNAQEMLNRTAS